MKNLIQLTFVATAFAALGTSAALASDSQLENRLAVQRQATEKQMTTVAVYADRRGVTQRHQMEERRTETRYEMRTNARGQNFGLYVPVR